MDERKSVKGTNVARDKLMSTDSSAQARTRRVAKWRSSMCRSPHARSLGAFRPRVRSTAQDERSVVCSSCLFTRSSIQVQAWHVHQTRPNRGVGLRRLGPWDSKTSSSREVSRDSQRLRHWTPDEPVEDLLIKVDRRLPSCSSSCLFHEADRRLDSSSLSCLFHEADRRQTQPSPTQQITTPTSRLSSSRGQTDLM